MAGASMDVKNWWSNEVVDGVPFVRIGNRFFQKLGPNEPDEVDRFERNCPIEGFSWRAHAALVRSQRETRLDELAVTPNSVALLESVMKKLARNTNVLIEGPPATAKTFTGELAAAMLGLRLVRINPGASTDVGELIGFYRPDRSGTYAWGDGAFAAGMRLSSQGVPIEILLDEGNLPSAGTMDRLLPALEPRRELLVHEHHADDVIRAPGLRIVAAINPANEPGRRQSSLAFVSRMKGKVHTAIATEETFVAAAKHWTSGRSAPSITIHGVSFAIDARVTALKHLGRVGGSLGTNLLPKLARVHATLGNQAYERHLGQHRRDGYTFDVRNFQAMLESLDHDVSEQRRHGGPLTDATPFVRQTLDEYYTMAVAAGADRDIVKDTLAREKLLALESGSVLAPKACGHDAEPGDLVRILRDGRSVLYTVLRRFGSRLRLVGSDQRQFEVDADQVEVETGDAGPPTDSRRRRGGKES